MAAPAHCHMILPAAAAAASRSGLPFPQPLPPPGRDHLTARDALLLTAGSVSGQSLVCRLCTDPSPCLGSLAYWLTDG